MSLVNSSWNKDPNTSRLDTLPLWYQGLYSLWDLKNIYNKLVLWKTSIKGFFEKYLEVILEKWWVEQSEWNINHYQIVINKFLNQEEWELIWNNNLAEKWLIHADPLNYEEFKDLEFLIHSLDLMRLEDFGINNWDGLWKKEENEIEKILSIINSTLRLFVSRFYNRLPGEIVDMNSELRHEYPTLVNYYNSRLNHSLEDNSDENFHPWLDDNIIVEQPNKNFIWPRNENEIRLDKYFLIQFNSCTSRLTKKTHKSYKEYQETYKKIINYTVEKPIPEIDLLYLIELINTIDFIESFNIFKQNESSSLLSWEEITQIFWKEIHKWFKSYILNKIYKIRTIELANESNKSKIQEDTIIDEISEILNWDNTNEYRQKSELAPDIINIAEWIEIYTIWEDVDISNYLVRNGRIISEFSWYDPTLIEYNWTIVIKILKNGVYSYIRTDTWELIWWEFDSIWDIEEWIDWDKVFRAAKKNRMMYISLKTWEPIGWKYAKVGILREWIDWDKVFKICSSTWSENYISLRTWSPITGYVWNFIVWEINDYLFWDKYFETYNIITNAGWTPVETEKKGIKISLKTWEQLPSLLSLVIPEIRKRFNWLMR